MIIGRNESLIPKWLNCGQNVSIRRIHCSIFCYKTCIALRFRSVSYNPVLVTVIYLQYQPQFDFKVIQNWNNIILSYKLCSDIQLLFIFIFDFQSIWERHLIVWKWSCRFLFFWWLSSLAPMSKVVSRNNSYRANT